MQISQKTQYALRAVFELAKRYGQGAVKIAEIAQAQAIPQRFLEVILNELKQGGFVASQRGQRGGYTLVRTPSKLTVGEVMLFVQGPIGPVSCVTETSGDTCPLYGDCAFLPMWEKVKRAITEIFDQTTFQDLVDREKDRAAEGGLSYCI